MTSCSRRPRSAAFLTCRFERSALTLPRMHNSLIKWHKREPLQEKAPGPGSGAARLLPCWPLTLPPASCWNRPRPETWPIWLPPRRPLPVSGPLPGPPSPARPGAMPAPRCNSEDHPLSSGCRTPRPRCILPGTGVPSRSSLNTAYWTVGPARPSGSAAPYTPVSSPPASPRP